MGLVGSAIVSHKVASECLAVVVVAVVGGGKQEEDGWRRLMNRAIEA